MKTNFWHFIVKTKYLESWTHTVSFKTKSQANQYIAELQKFAKKDYPYKIFKVKRAYSNYMYSN